MKVIPKITLDANCIINLLDYSSPTATSVDFLSALVKHSHLRNIDIAITTRVEVDINSDKDKERSASIIQRIGQFPVIGTVARYGVSKYGNGDVYAGGKGKEIGDELKRVIFPGLSLGEKRFKNKINDIDHLVGHIINERDIFVTDDKGILGKNKTLKSSLGLVVMSPEACLEYIEREASQHEASEVVFHGKDGYQNSALSGKACFNYSNNNGRYFIGSGMFLFETMWTHASQNSIHSYSDPASIDSIALDKQASEINQIRDASSLDFSSRSRTPHEGQVLVLKNKNGIYAALKIHDIKYEDRGDDSDEITFSFHIQTDRSTDFSAC